VLQKTGAGAQRPRVTAPAGLFGIREICEICG
jgi:hypothetical protein